MSDYHEAVYGFTPRQNAVRDLAEKIADEWFSQAPRYRTKQALIDTIRLYIEAQDGHH
jgi:hypothetical protein